MEFSVRPIGTVSNDRTEAVDDDWDRVTSRIQLDADQMELEWPDGGATAGLREFSHVEVLYLFHALDDSKVQHGARRPRSNPDWPEVGILAQRSRHHPNRLGSTVCELLTVRPGGIVEVRGLDAIDGTPVLDIKPYFAQFGPRGDLRQPAWVDELTADYWVADDAEPERLDEVTRQRWEAEAMRSPTEVGTVELIAARPESGQRLTLEHARLDSELGLVGDNWLERGAASTPDGSADPRAQLNLMNSRIASLVADGDTNRIAEAGDQLYLDLDLGPDNLPPGTRLGVGEAVIEITDKPHTGCAKFTRRFGLAAHRWINGREGRALNRRGVCARVVTGGLVRRGDTVHKLEAGRSTNAGQVTT